MKHWPHSSYNQPNLLIHITCLTSGKKKKLSLRPQLNTLTPLSSCPQLTGFSTSYCPFYSSCSFSIIYFLIGSSSTLLIKSSFCCFIVSFFPPSPSPTNTDYTLPYFINYFQCTLCKRDKLFLKFWTLEIKSVGVWTIYS